jgi:hypothetical protein
MAKTKRDLEEKLDQIPLPPPARIHILSPEGDEIGTFPIYPAGGGWSALEYLQRACGLQDIQDRGGLVVLLDPSGLVQSSTPGSELYALWAYKKSGGGLLKVEESWLLMWGRTPQETLDFGKRTPDWILSAPPITPNLS